jgi:hypothetical protein
MIPFTYGGFWDVPRYIFCQIDGKHLLLQSEFDDHLDEYAPDYEVFQLPAPFQTGSVFSWQTFPLSEAKLIGRIPVAAIEFDETKRKELNAAPILDLVGFT